MLGTDDFQTLMGEMIDGLEAELNLEKRSVRYLRHESVHCQTAVYEEIARLGLPEGARVMEIGAGFGMLAYGLAAGGFEVTALDYYIPFPTQESPVYTVVQRHSRDPLRLRYVKQNIEEPLWDIGSGEFDLVISVDVIEHVSNVVRFMENASRSLKPGGYHIVHTPNYGALARRFQGLKSVVRPVWPTDMESFTRSNPWFGHVREYNDRELPQLFETFGFTVLAQRFPKLIDRERLRNLDGELRTKMKVYYALTEMARRAVPSLGPAQLVVGQKRATPPVSQPIQA